MSRLVFSDGYFGSIVEDGSGVGTELTGKENRSYSSIY